MSDKKSEFEDHTKSKWEAFAEEQEPEQESSSEQQDEVSEQKNAERDCEDTESGHRLEDQITALQKQLTDMQDSKLRLSAELQNVRERAARDVTKAHKFANKQLLEELLPVLDSLSRGLQNSHSAEQDAKQALIDGMELTLEMFHKVLTGHGVVLISPAVGDAFDPEIHEAMSMQSNPDAKSNTVLQLLQPGYSLNGRTIRAAMVIVAG